MGTKYERRLEKLENQTATGSLLNVFICPIPKQHRAEACAGGDCECARERREHMQATRWQGQFVTIDQESAGL